MKDLTTTKAFKLGKVAVLDHYRAQADAAVAQTPPEPTFFRPEDVGRCAHAREAWPRHSIDLQQAEFAAGVMLRDVIGVDAVFGPVHIDLGDGRTVICTLQISEGARA